MKVNHKQFNEGRVEERASTQGCVCVCVRMCIYLLLRMFKISECQQMQVISFTISISAGEHSEL
jgi:hypothetical protein